MSILHDHFKRKAAKAGEGTDIISGLYLDVVDTLVDGHYVPNASLIAFAVWNKAHRLLGRNHVFSGDVTGAYEHLRKAKVSLADIGVTRIKSKYSVYQQLTKEDRNKSALEIVIDDLSPVHTGAVHTGLVVTWLDPHEEAMVRFLRDREYLQFAP